VRPALNAIWIKLGFAAFATSFLIDVAVRAPITRRMARGALDPRRGGRLLALLARVELTVLFLAVADMVAKPTGADAWTLAAGGAILALVTLGAAFAGMPARKDVAAA